MVTVTSFQPCPVCQGQSRPYLVVDGYAILACGDCGHQFVPGPFERDHVAQVYGDDYFFGGGAGYPDYLAQGDIVSGQGRAYGRLLRNHMAPGRVLDAGCAAGFLLRGLSQEGWRGAGLDPNARMVAHARDVLGFEATVATLETYRAPEPFDLVVLVQVIGHVFDLQAAMASAAQATRPGGHVLVEYWDRDSRIARALGRRWHEYSPPSVLHWFAGRDLDLLMGRHGFERVAMGKPPKHISVAHVTSLLTHKLGHSVPGRLALAPLSVLPPALRLPYPAFDLRWALFRTAGG